MSGMTRSSDDLTQRPPQLLDSPDPTAFWFQLANIWRRPPRGESRRLVSDPQLILKCRHGVRQRHLCDTCLGWRRGPSAAEAADGQVFSSAQTLVRVRRILLRGG